MGSVVKPAMVLGALEDGVITTSNSSLPDVPIYLKGTPVKKSWYNIGAYSSLTADHALEISSNIYMMRLAMREGNAKYEANSYLTMDNDIFSKMRRHFGEFGLGIKTGIDLPGEVTGLEVPPTTVMVPWPLGPHLTCPTGTTMRTQPCSWQITSAPSPMMATGCVRTWCSRLLTAVRVVRANPYCPLRSPKYWAKLGQRRRTLTWSSRGCG